MAELLPLVPVLTMKDPSLPLDIYKKQATIYCFINFTHDIPSITVS